MINWIFCLFKFAVDDFYQRLPTELKMTAYLLLFTFCVIYLIVSLHTLFLFLRLVLTGTDLMIQIMTSVSNFLLFLLHDNKNKCKYVCGELCVFLNSLHLTPHTHLIPPPQTTVQSTVYYCLQFDFLFFHIQY